MSGEVKGSHILDQLGTLGTCSGKNAKVLIKKMQERGREVQQLALFGGKQGNVMSKLSF